MRNYKIVNDNIIIVYGVDHALGWFCDVIDKRLVDYTPEGEGYIYSFCKLFGIMSNKAKIEHEDVLDALYKKKVKNLVDTLDSYYEKVKPFINPIN